MTDRRAVRLKPEPHLVERSWQAAPTGEAHQAALSLGARLVGCPLVYAAAGETMPPAARVGSPVAAFVEDTEIHAVDGTLLGTLRAVASRDRPPFRPVECEVIDDVAATIAALEEARRAIGRLDHVTLLPNRRAFLDEVSHRPDGGEPDLVVLLALADARQFNEILRVLGHAGSEAFIHEGALRIVNALPHLRIYHVSVLSFAFVVPGAGTQVPRDVVDTLVAAFRTPILCNGVPITQRVGIGLCELPPAPESPAEALRAALTAAQDSRNRGQPFARYDRRSDEAQVRAFTLLKDLHQALDRDEGLKLAYQPRVDLATGAVRSVEALLRWTHPTFGPVSPGEFIPLAEATALVTPLTRWVVEAATRQTAAWRDEGIALRTSVNVAPANLHDGEFTDGVLSAIDRNRLSPDALELEITEGTATAGDPVVLQELDKARAAGMEIAIDDFGTGYSNLVYLTRLPATILKIDQGFVRPMVEDARRQLLVRSVIDMAHGLGYRVVAEGIETAAAYEMLAGWGCDEGQGFLMSRPVAADEIPGWLKQR